MEELLRKMEENLYKKIVTIENRMIELASILTNAVKKAEFEEEAILSYETEYRRLLKESNILDNLYDELKTSREKIEKLNTPTKP